MVQLENKVLDLSGISNGREWDIMAKVVLSDYSFIKDKIVMKLVNSGKGYMEDICFKPYLDMAAAFYVLSDYEYREISLIRVEGNMLHKWGVTEDMLFTEAKKNMERLFPASIKTFSEKIMETPEGRDIYMKEGASVYKGAGEGIYIITNTFYINGAVSILYDGVLENFAKEKGWERFIILLPSVHEAMFIQYNGTGSGELEKISRILTENRDSMKTEDFLSSSIYIYDRLGEKLEILEI